jgi:predicted  nucleic acid-binding Zn-ribbon protein
VQVDLPSLLVLQDKDAAVRHAEEQLAKLQPEIDELDSTLADIEDQLAAARGATEEAEKRRSELEERIESYRVMQERRKQKLEWVRGAKEAAAIMAELDLARSVLAKEEAEWIRSADKVQEAQHNLNAIEEVALETRETQGPTREELAQRAGELEKELEAAVVDRDVAAKDINAQQLAQYRRILMGRAPQALYPLRSGACGHCFTSVPLHRVQQIKSGSTVENCEACGVWVYNPTPPE